MREIRSSGAVRGVRSDPYPCRDTTPADAEGSAVLGTLVLTRNSGPDGRSDSGDSSEVQRAQQPVIVAGVGVNIGSQDGGPPFLRVQLEPSGDLRHADAERPP